MAQFDVHRSISTGGLIVECESDLLDHLSTRFVIPLLEPDDAPAPVSRLNPKLDFDQRSVILATQLSAGVPRTDLGPRLGSLAGERYTIQGALDTLTGSY